jgi:Ca2+:H+ antiporter
MVYILSNIIVGGLLNATCGNITELIIAIFALSSNQIAVVKYSLLGSILSNLLLVLGTSLLCGGIANLGVEQKYDKVSPYKSISHLHSLKSQYST